MSQISSTPDPPYYAVVFTSKRAKEDIAYGSTASRMVELARTMVGFLGIESVRDSDGFGVTVSYWQDEESIRAWKGHAEHLAAQAEGKSSWYEEYSVRVAKVERAYRF